MDATEFTQKLELRINVGPPQHNVEGTRGLTV